LKGWVAQLSEHYIRRSDVVNRGVSGYTSRQARHIVSYALSDEDLARAWLITIWFGTNDAVLPSFDPIRHVSPEEYKSHLAYMIETIRGRARQLHNFGLDILLITPPPVDEQRRKTFLYPSRPSEMALSDRTNQMTRHYVKMCRQLAAEYSIFCLELHEDMLSSKDCSIFLQEDGLHLSTEGNQFVIDQLLDFIEREMPEKTPERLPFIYPPHVNIEPGRESESLKQLIQ
jgi:isoamyl acetate esterase